MSRTCWSIWWLQQHRDGSTLAFLFVFVLGRQVKAFIRGVLGLDWPYILFTRSPHIYFIVVYLFRSTDDVSLSLIPLVHVVDQEETGYGVGHRYTPIMSVLTPPLGHGGHLRRVWGLHVSLEHGGRGWSPLGSSRPLFNDFQADTTL